MGGFVLPIMFGALMDLTGIRSSAFMLMYGVVWVSLIWMYFTEVRNTPVMGAQGAAQAAAAADFSKETSPCLPPPPAGARASAHHLGTGGQVLLGARRRSHCQLNLWISVPALFLAFAIWQVWSVVAVSLPGLGFKYSTNQLFWLAAAPALSGATLRIFYSFMVPLVAAAAGQPSPPPRC